MLMGAIQVKNVPPELHDELRRRAAAEGRTVGEVILESLRRDLRRQTMREWLDDLEDVTKDIPKISGDEFDEIVRDARSDRRWGGDDDGR
jgi:plasmid stability protein